MKRKVEHFGLLTAISQARTAYQIILACSDLSDYKRTHGKKSKLKFDSSRYQHSLKKPGRTDTLKLKKTCVSEHYRYIKLAFLDDCSTIP